MSNYTPGPWSIWRLAPDSDPKQRLIIVANDSETEVCGIVGNEADAVLIAAVPELLAVVRRVAESEAGQDLTRAAREALAKAGAV